MFVYELRGCGVESLYWHLNFRIAPALSKEFIQANIECGFTLIRARDMIIAYSQFLLIFNILPSNRSSRSIKKVFLKILQNSQGNNCARVSFLTKLQAYSTLLKKRLWHRCFPVNFTKFSRTSLFTEHPGTTASKVKPTREYPILVMS